MTAHKPYKAMKDSGIEWIGSIPPHWKVLPFYTCANEISAPNTGLKETNLLSLSYGRIIRKDINKLEGLTPASFEGYNIIEANDIVFRFTDLQNDKNSLRSAMSPERGIITSAYTSVRPRATPRFFNYLMRAYDTIKVFYGIGGGIRQSMKFDDLKRLPVILPDEAEREAIADYLDRETVRIDKLISRKAHFIKLLTEKRQALITNAVTKGLNPKAKMRDSSVAWLGKVPEHWAVSALCYLGRIYSGTTPDRDVSSYWNGTVPWIKTSEVNWMPIREAEEFITEEALAKTTVRLSSPGTMLMAMYGQGVTRGRVALLEIEAAYNQACAAISFGPRIVPEYAIFFFIAAYNYVRDFGNETSQTNLNSEIVGKFKMTIPPIDEQHIIVSHLNQYSGKIDRLIKKSERSIEILREHRTSLITAAVTGKIDLRVAA